MEQHIEIYRSVRPHEFKKNVFRKFLNIPHIYKIKWGERFSFGPSVYVTRLKNLNCRPTWMIIWRNEITRNNARQIYGKYENSVSRKLKYNGNT